MSTVFDECPTVLDKRTAVNLEIEKCLASMGDNAPSGEEQPGSNNDENKERPVGTSNQTGCTKAILLEPVKKLDCLLPFLLARLNTAGALFREKIRKLAEKRNSENENKKEDNATGGITPPHSNEQSPSDGEKLSNAQNVVIEGPPTVNSQPPPESPESQVIDAEDTDSIPVSLGELPNLQSKDSEVCLTDTRLKNTVAEEVVGSKNTVAEKLKESTNTSAEKVHGSKDTVAEKAKESTNAVAEDDAAVGVNTSAEEDATESRNTSAEDEATRTLNTSADDDVTGNMNTSAEEDATGTLNTGPEDDATGRATTIAEEDTIKNTNTVAEEGAAGSTSTVEDENATEEHAVAYKKTADEERVVRSENTITENNRAMSETTVTEEGTAVDKNCDAVNSVACENAVAEEDSILNKNTHAEKDVNIIEERISEDHASIKDAPQSQSESHKGSDLLENADDDDLYEIESPERSDDGMCEVELVPTAVLSPHSTDDEDLCITEGNQELSEADNAVCSKNPTDIVPSEAVEAIQLSGQTLTESTIDKDSLNFTNSSKKSLSEIATPKGNSSENRKRLAEDDAGDVSVSKRFKPGITNGTGNEYCSYESSGADSNSVDARDVLEEESTRLEVGTDVPVAKTRETSTGGDQNNCDESVPENNQNTITVQTSVSASRVSEVTDHMQHDQSEISDNEFNYSSQAVVASISPQDSPVPPEPSLDSVQALLRSMVDIATIETEKGHPFNCQNNEFFSDPCVANQDAMDTIEDTPVHSCSNVSAANEIQRQENSTDTAVQAEAQGTEISGEERSSEESTQKEVAQATNGSFELEDNAIMNGNSNEASSTEVVNGNGSGTEPATQMERNIANIGEVTNYPVLSIPEPINDETTSTTEVVTPNTLQLNVSATTIPVAFTTINASPERLRVVIDSELTTANAESPILIIPRVEGHDVTPTSIALNKVNIISGAGNTGSSVASVQGSCIAATQEMPSTGTVGLLKDDDEPRYNITVRTDIFEDSLSNESTTIDPISSLVEPLSTPSLSQENISFRQNLVQALPSVGNNQSQTITQSTAPEATFQCTTPMATNLPLQNLVSLPSSQTAGATERMSGSQPQTGVSTQVAKIASNFNLQGSNDQTAQYTGSQMSGTSSVNMPPPTRPSTSLSVAASSENLSEIHKDVVNVLDAVLKQGEETIATLRRLIESYRGIQTGDIVPLDVLDRALDLNFRWFEQIDQSRTAVQIKHKSLSRVSDLVRSSLSEAEPTLEELVDYFEVLLEATTLTKKPYMNEKWTGVLIVLISRIIRLLGYFMCCNKTPQQSEGVFHNVVFQIMAKPNMLEKFDGKHNLSVQLVNQWQCIRAGSHSPSYRQGAMLDHVYLGTNKFMERVDKYKQMYEKKILQQQLVQEQTRVSTNNQGSVQQSSSQPVTQQEQTVIRQLLQRGPEQGPQQRQEIVTVNQSTPVPGMMMLQQRQASPQVGAVYVPMQQHQQGANGQRLPRAINLNERSAGAEQQTYQQYMMNEPQILRGFIKLPQNRQRFQSPSNIQQPSTVYAVVQTPTQQQQQFLPNAAIQHSQHQHQVRLQQQQQQQLLHQRQQQPQQQPQQQLPHQRQQQQLPHQRQQQPHQRPLQQQQLQQQLPHQRPLQQQQLQQQVLHQRLQQPQQQLLHQRYLQQQQVQQQQQQVQQQQQQVQQQQVQQQQQQLSHQRHLQQQQVQQQQYQLQLQQQVQQQQVQQHQLQQPQQQQLQHQNLPQTGGHSMQVLRRQQIPMNYSSSSPTCMPSSTIHYSASQHGSDNIQLERQQQNSSLNADEDDIQILEVDPSPTDHRVRVPHAQSILVHTLDGTKIAETPLHPTLFNVGDSSVTNLPRAMLPSPQQRPFSGNPSSTPNNEHAIATLRRNSAVEVRGVSPQQRHQEQLAARASTVPHTQSMPDLNYVYRVSSSGSQQSAVAVAGHRQQTVRSELRSQLQQQSVQRPQHITLLRQNQPTFRSTGPRQKRIVHQGNVPNAGVSVHEETGNTAPARVSRTRLRTSNDGFFSQSGHVNVPHNSMGSSSGVDGSRAPGLAITSVSSIGSQAQSLPSINSRSSSRLDINLAQAQADTVYYPDAEGNVLLDLHQQQRHQR